jgi:hypothetical protein
MPSKKKSKPSFQVPEELQKAPQAGWVYRSDRQTKEAKPTPKAGSGSRGPAKPAAAETAAHAPSHAPHRDKTSPPPKKKESSSGSSGGILDLTAKALSAGFGTVGNIVLLTTRIIAAPVSLGRRIFGL